MSVPGPVLGPCSAWIDGDDVAACCDPSSSDAGVFDDVAAVASMVMFELVGRRFSGLCERTVRPCVDPCAGFCGVGPWAWRDGRWANECGDRCGCGSLAVVKLAGYPVREVSEVKIDGAIIDAATYRLDRWRDLVRLDDPGPPVVRRTWPACQNLALNDDQPGTFSVTYSYGADPPQLGRDAAAALACELWKACPPNAGECRLPSKVTRVVRQGVTIERATSIAAMLRSGSTGLPLIDAFLAAYNPGGVRRAPAIFSPDIAPYPREVGS